MKSFIKNILKSGFKKIGFDIIKIKKSPESLKEDPDKIRLLYYENEGKRFKWMQQYNFKTIIDVGANEGQFAGKILTMFPEAEIHCFEPLHDVYELLKANFKSYKNVVLYNFGLGAKAEQKEIFRNENSASSSILEMLDLHKTNFTYAVKVLPENILIKRLDEIFVSSINGPLLIKIDVQGYESYVLEGGNKTISHSDMVIIETSFYPLYTGQPLFEDIYNYFIKAGFKYAGNVEQLLSPADESILQADAVFINKKHTATHPVAG